MRSRERGCYASYTVNKHYRRRDADAPGSMAMPRNSAHAMRVRINMFMRSVASAPRRHIDIILPYTLLLQARL